MNSKTFDDLRIVIDSHSESKALCEHTLGPNYDGPPIAAIFRASMQGCIDECNRQIDYAWQQLRGACVD